MASSNPDPETNPDFTIDPTLAAQMGFSAFGPQPTSQPRSSKRAKHTHDPTGANSTSLGTRPTARAVDPETVAEIADGNPAITSPREPGQAEPTFGNSNPGSQGQRSRGGERGYAGVNERGDAVYYDASFIEDPWEGMMGKRWGER